MKDIYEIIIIINVIAACYHNFIDDFSHLIINVIIVMGSLICWEIKQGGKK